MHWDSHHDTSHVRVAITRQRSLSRRPPTLSRLRPPVTPVLRTPLRCSPDYTSGFIDYWSKFFKKQNGIVMTALVVGAVCLFIITRGKWRK